MSIRNKSPIVLMLFLLAGSASSAPVVETGNNSSTAGAPISGLLVAPIAIVRIHSLNFSSVMCAPGGGVVTIAYDNCPSFTGGLSHYPGDPLTAAEFSVTGMPGFGYGVAVPTSVTVSNGGSGVSSMTVDNFLVHYWTSLSGSGPGIIGPLGFQNISVGAKLHVLAGQEHGAYSGTFDVTVQYN